LKTLLVERVWFRVKVSLFAEGIGDETLIELKAPGGIPANRWRSEVTKDTRVFSMSGQWKFHSWIEDAWPVQPS
jgi:hypothetical protein